MTTCRRSPRAGAAATSLATMRNSPASILEMSRMSLKSLVKRLDELMAVRRHSCSARAMLFAQSAYEAAARAYVRGLERLAASDLAFHEEILRLSGSRAIQRLWATMDAIIRSRTYTILRRSWRADIVDYTVESHAPLVAAFRAGDPDQAQAAVERHIFETRDLSQTNTTANEA